MPTLNKSYLFNLAFFGTLCGIYAVASVVQYHTILNHDVAWLAEASKRLLHGGTYSNDFFENNPPLILYLYLPPVMLSEHFSISIAHSISVCIFLIATVSLVICYDLLKKILHHPENVLIRPLVLLVAALFLVSPFHDFGQREHLFFIFAMPCFLLAAYQLENHVVTSRYAILIGLFAGIGFAIKPYFLFPLILVEIYYIYCQKNLLAWRRDDLMAIVLVITIYLMAVFVFNPDYIFTVLPYAWHWCHFSDKLPSSFILMSTAVYSCLVSGVFAVIQYHVNPYKKLITVFMLAIMGLLISYVAQTTNYNYHLIPSFSLAVFLSAFLYGCQLLHGISKKLLLLVSTLFIAVVAGLTYLASNVELILSARPMVFLGYIAIIFVGTLFLTQAKRTPRSLLSIIAVVLAIVGSAYIFAELVRSTDLIIYRFPLTLLFLVALLGLAAARMTPRKGQAIFSGTVGVILFALPLSYVYTCYFTLKEKYTPCLLSYLQANITNQPIYFLSTRNEAFPYADYHSNFNAVSRFSSFWMLGSLVKEPQFVKHTDAKRRLEGKNFLAEMIAADLNTKKPTYVIVDVEQVKRNFYTVAMTGLFKYKRTVLDFDYVAYFSENKDFAQAWHPYHYVTTLYREQIFPYAAVYQRQSSKG